MFVGIAINLTGRLLASASPASLFANGEQGVWYDPSDISTLFQDNAGTTPVTTPGQQVGKMLDKSGRGNHATQSTSTQRPIYGINPIVGTRNRYTYTERFDNAYWGKTNVTIGADITAAPNGTITADKIQETSATTFFAVATNPSSFGFSTTYTWSCYAKAAERNFIFVNFSAISLSGSFDLTTGQTNALLGSPSLSAVSVGNGWWRCSMTFTTTASGINLLYNIFGPILSAGGGTYTGIAGYGIYVWGAQLELGSSATAYQRVGNQYDVTQYGIQSVGYLAFDGVDDNMVTGTITPGIDKSQMFVGLRKLSDAAKAVVAELSTTSVTNNGSITLLAPGSAAATNYVFSSRGTITSTATATATPYVAPLTNVVTTIGDIAADTATLRVNGTVAATSATDQGTGNYLAYILYIGSRAGTGSFFNGRLYSQILRFGPNLTTGQITSTESWVNSETGAY